MKLRNDLILRHVGDDHIIVDPGQDMVDMSKVFNLNETAAWLWEELSDQEFDQVTIKNLLLERYEVTDSQAEQDATYLLQYFVDQGLTE